MSVPNPAVVCYLMSLEKLSDDQILALSNATAFGRVSELNLAFNDAKQLNIINRDGTFHDLLLDALSIEVSRRFK